MNMTTPVSPQAQISADRFVLRPLQRSDSGLVEMYMGDQRVAHMTRDIPHPLPPNYTETLLRSADDPNREADIWAIDGSGHGHAEVMGLMTMLRLDRNQSEIRYWTAPAFWNHGIATEAVAAILRANPQGSCDMFAEVFQDNPGSARVLTNAGFGYLGDAEAYSVARQSVVPTWTYARKMGQAAA